MSGSKTILVRIITRESKIIHLNFKRRLESHQAKDVLDSRQQIFGVQCEGKIFRTPLRFPLKSIGCSRSFHTRPLRVLGSACGHGRNIVTSFEVTRRFQPP
jgi:hypothetical protein